MRLSAALIILLMSFTVLVAACTPEDDASPSERLPPEEAVEETQTSITYQCTPETEDELTFTAHFAEQEAQLALPERFHAATPTLPQVTAASGARYAGDQVVFWSNGPEALLEIDGVSFYPCVAEATDHDVSLDFRAIGQEPGWLLELAEGAPIRFAYNYAQDEAVVPYVEATTNADGHTVYHSTTPAHDLRITIADERCQDIMSGEEFPATVTVEHHGETYHGCGRPMD